MRVEEWIHQASHYLISWVPGNVEGAITDLRRLIASEVLSLPTYPEGTRSLLNAAYDI